MPKEQRSIKDTYTSPLTPLPSLEELATANPEIGKELAIAVENTHAELLTFEEAAPQLEDISVRTLMGLMESTNISAKERLAAVKETNEVLGKKNNNNNPFGQSLITGQNVQVNQITNPDITRHLLKASKDMQEITEAKVVDIKQAEAGRG